MYKFQGSTAKFIKTAIKPKDYPILRNAAGDLMPEIGVVGRSNVGKSTLLNHLFRRKNLVKTSATPGKTQALNYFTIDDALAFVDLPGYGYARAPGSVRKAWGPMVQNYLEKSSSLKLIIFLLDIRRTPNEDDLQFLEWAAYYEVPIILVMTKVDKVKRNEKDRNTQKILKAINVAEMPWLHYSSTKNIGRDRLIYLIRDALSKSEEASTEG